MPDYRTIPDRLVMRIGGLTERDARRLAHDAVRFARQDAPKLSGASSRRFKPLYGRGYFGVAWLDPYVWYQEQGIKAFTMTALAGKTIPMWVDDPTGEEARKNPKAQTRTTESGKRQVLIFRRAARMGQRKWSRRRTGGRNQWVQVPASYPGAPGRIALRQAPQPFTSPGKVAARIAPKNIGVRWRHPGLAPRNFLHHGLVEAARQNGYPQGSIFALTEEGILK